MPRRKIMKKIIIGITPRSTKPEDGEKTFIHQRYLRPINERGAIPLMLPLENPDIEDLLCCCDGFLITGGNDIDPSFYNESNEEGISKEVDLRLDAIDKVVVDYAKKHQVPLLGICRGHQSINVFLGGSLLQDLGEKAKHHEKFANQQVAKIVDGTLFSAILPAEFETNSYHHQAVKDLAPGMIGSIISPDDVIEGIEHETLPIFSVQWHPEMRPTSLESIQIFDKFIDLCTQYKSTRFQS